MQTIFHIKPHHFVDIITKYGAGTVPSTPHPYGHAVHTIAALLLGDRDALLEMKLGADDICGPCMHNVGGLCDDAIDTSFRPDAPLSKRACANGISSSTVAGANGSASKRATG